MVKNFKKIMACLLAFAVVFTCIGSALAVSAETAIVTNANGNATDVGIWYTPYNTQEFWAHRFADPEAEPVGYDSLLPDGSYGVPFAGNADIIDFHIEQMAKAGIDFIMIDLTNGGVSPDVEMGWSETPGFSGSWITEYTKLTCERISKWNDEHGWKIRYAISVGTYPSVRKDLSIMEAATYQAEGVQELFLNNPVYGDDYYIYDGKPLITLFDWHCVPTDDEAVKLACNMAGTILNEFTVRSASLGQAGTYGWYNKDGIVNVTDEVALVSPGHYNEGLSLTRAEGATYDNAWKTVIESDITPRIVMISSFNDYMENTAVFVTKSDRVNTAIGEEAWQDPYQYWDMTIDYIKQLRTKSGDSAEVNTGAKNLALSATVTQDHWCLEAAGPLKCINDGKISNRTLGYANQGSNDHEKFYFEFDYAQTINNVNLYADGIEAAKYGFKDVAIDVLVDGVWTRVAEVHRSSVAEQLVSVYFAPVKTTKVAIVVNVKNQGDKTFAAFGEVEIYNNASVTEADYTGIQKGIAIDGKSSENYALGGTVTTNTSTRGNSGGMWTLGYVNDGSVTSTHYAYVSGPANVNYSKNPYVQVDFASAKVINNVNFYTCNLEGKYYNDYAVDVKLANGTWKRVATRYYSVEGKIATSKAQKIAFFFEDVKAVAFRITSDTQNCQDVLNGGNPANQNLIFSCSEVQAFYNSAATVNTYTGTAKPTDSVNIPGIKSANYALAGSGVTVKQDHWCLEGAGPLSSINDGVKSNRVLGYANQNAANNERYYFTFDEAKVINNVNLYADGVEANKYSFKDVAIDVKLTDGRLMRVAEIHDLPTMTNAQLVPVYFAPVEVTEVILTVDMSNGSSTTFAAFAEVEIFYDSSDVEYTGINKATVPSTVIDPFKSTVYTVGGTVSDNFAKHWLSIDSIVDGNKDDSRSGSDFGTAQCAYYQVDFAGGAAVINTINVVWDRLENYTVRDMAADVKLPDGSWQRVAEIHLTEAIDWAQRNGVATALTFADIEVTAIRVWFNKENRVGSLVSLTELEAYYSSSVPTYTGINAAPSDILSIPSSGTKSAANYALGQKVTTSNTNFSLFLPEYPAFRLTDGAYTPASTADCAISNYVNGLASFTVNYDKAYTINKVVLLLSPHEATTRPDEYIVEVKTVDGWVRVGVNASTQSAGHNTEIFYFEAIECTAVRVIANNKLGAAGSPNFRLNEIETYFEEGVTEDKYTGATSTLDAQYTAGIQGDVDGDSWITALDLAYAVNAYVGAHKVAAGNVAIMDTNRDGKYDIRDYIYLVEEVAIREANLAGLNK